MQKCQPNILVISNMGPKPSAPFQGGFVQNQVDALRSATNPLNVAYHYMRWHSDSLLNKYLKYPVFVLHFIWCFIFCRRTFNILHVHFFYPTIWLALLYKALRNPRAKIVVTCHGSDIYKYQQPGALYRWCAERVDQWIFASHALMQKFSLPIKKAVVLPAGIDEQFRDTVQLSYQQKTIDVLFVGSLDHNKGVDRLLAILPELSDKSVVVVGNGPMRNELQNAEKRFSQLRLVGAKERPALKQLYQQARVLISLSRHEAFGLVMAEAMACYTPVLATDTDGSREQVISDSNGWCISQLSESQLIASVVAQLRTIDSLASEQASEQSGTQSSVQYAQMQRQARLTAEPYLLQQIVQRLQLIYQELM